MDRVVALREEHGIHLRAGESQWDWREAGCWPDEKEERKDSLIAESIERMRDLTGRQEAGHRFLVGAAGRCPHHGEPMPWPADDPEEEELEIPDCDWPAGHPVAGWPSGYYDFIALFNDGQNFECHETLEAVWLDTQGERKDFYQGLIHVATAFHHVSRANMKGARLLLRSGHDLLAPYADGFMAFPVEGFRAMCREWFPLVDKAWRRKRAVGLDEAPIVKIELRAVGGEGSEE
jgi:hypothetical protein